MADENTQPAAAEKKSRAVSKREILAGPGATQDDWIDARGFRYTTLSSGFAAEILFADLPDAVVRGLAAFGGLTLAGNVTNTVRNSDEGKAAPESEVAQGEKDALLAWIDNLKAGNWTSPRGEIEAGTQLLAEAYVRAMSGEGKPVGSVEEVKEKLDAKTKEERAAIRKHAKVAAAIAAIQAERKAARAAEASGEMPDL